MKKFLAFLFTLMMCLTAQASLFDGKYSPSQIFDVARSGCYSVGGPCSVSNMIAPFIAPYTNWTHATFAVGDYVQFYDNGAGSNNIGIKQFAADGTFKQTISSSGYVQAIGTGIVYIGQPSQGGGTGYFISNSQGYSNGSSTNVTVQYVNPTSTQLASYAATTTPLAAGQSAPAPAPAPVNNTTAAGTMPGGFIGRVLNNNPATWQTYSFAFTPTSTGSNYVMLAFRQDPAYWSVDNIKVTAAGSTTNLLQNGGMDTGGTITAQTNNGATQVSTPTYWGVAYQAGIYPGAAGMWNSSIWYDGAVGSFDAIYQGLNLTAGVTYTLSFMVAGDNTADSSLSGAVQLGVYAGPCGSLSLAPDQCSLPGTSGYTTLATPQDGATAGNAAPTITNSSTVDSVSSSSSTVVTNVPAQFQVDASTYTFIGNINNVTITTVTTPVTTNNWSDGSTTTVVGNSTTSQTVNTTYAITPGQQVSPADLNPYKGTNKNSVTIDQVLGSASNKIQATQKGTGNNIEMWVSGSNNQVSANQGFTVNSLGTPNESTMVSNNNFAALTVGGNGNNATSQQTGLMNSSVIAIGGNNNTATTIQSGNNNQSYTSVNSGNNNTATTSQTGNGNLSIVNAYGNGNNATVTQSGNNNGALLSLTNAGGPVTVNLLQQAATQGQTFVVQQTCTNGAGCSVSVQQNR